MAVVTTVSNHMAYQLGVGNVNFSSDTFVAYLMNTTFAFDKDTHAAYANISSDILATGNGYSPLTLTGVSVTEDDTEDGLLVTWNDAQWTASGGAIGPSGAMCIIDDTTADDTVVMCVDFGTDITAADGLNFTVEDLAFKGLTA